VSIAPIGCGGAVARQFTPAPQNLRPAATLVLPRFGRILHIEQVATNLRVGRFIRIRDLTWNIGMKNHGPAMQVRGAPSPLGVEFLGATDMGTRSVLESVSVQKHIFESESVLEIE
jgi:hypothetical protein